MDYHPEQHSLRCPKCHQGIDEVTYDDITIDRCTGCQGLWFDAGEARQRR